MKNIRWNRIAFLPLWPMALWAAGTFVDWDFRWPHEWSDIARAAWLLLGWMPVVILVTVIILINLDDSE